MAAFIPRFFDLTAGGGLHVKTVHNIPKKVFPGVVARWPEGPLHISIDGDRKSDLISTIEGVLICSMPLAEAMTSEGLQLGDRYPVQIVHSFGRIKADALPDFVYFRCRRGLELSDESFYFPPDAKIDLPMPWYRRIPKLESWNGDDVMGFIKQDWTSLACSRRFVEAFRRRKWKNFSVRALDLPRYYVFQMDTLDKYGLAPSPQWYPEEITPHPANVDGPGGS